ncbi:MAG: neutral zinc metallopeptidase, partial [bacterium]|nr:neutral zinc metallopeptidase [bacterium]
MRMEGQEQSRNVEDRRRMRPATIVGGGGLLAIILAVLFTFLRGGGVGDAVQVGLQQAQRQMAMQVAASSQTPVNPEEDEQAIFAGQVLRLTEEVWGELFPSMVGKPYREPTMVLFRDGVSSA